MSRQSLLLTLGKYIKYILTKAQMDGAKGISTPMVGGCKLTKHGSDYMTDPHLHRSMVEGLQHATITRSEISFSVNKVSQFNHSC